MTNAILVAHFLASVGALPTDEDPIWLRLKTAMDSHRLSLAGGVRTVAKSDPANYFNSAWSLTYNSPVAASRLGSL